MGEVGAPGSRSLEDADSLGPSKRQIISYIFSFSISSTPHHLWGIITIHPSNPT